MINELVAQGLAAGAPRVQEAAGELNACAREAAILRRIGMGLGNDVDAALWRVIERLLEWRDLETADLLWSRAVSALDRGILSRLVGWVRSLDAAGADKNLVRSLVAGGPDQHDYRSGGGRRAS